MFRAVGMVLLTILTSFYFSHLNLPFAGSQYQDGYGRSGIDFNDCPIGTAKRFYYQQRYFSSIDRSGSRIIDQSFAVTWNDTYDYTYATYLVSMWVWLSGAYVVIQAIKKLHGGISVEQVCNYLIVVCVVQCLIAFAMTQYLPLKNFVDSFLGSTGFMGKMEDRMYGIGASLDVAGSRFSVILVMIVCLLSKMATTDKKNI